MASRLGIKPKKPISSSKSNLCTALFFSFILLFTLLALLLLHTPPTTTSLLCTTFSPHPTPWSGDLRTALFAWNRLPFIHPQNKHSLKIAVFSRKWPIATVPGGMERHAHTLHTAMSLLGHKVHVFTSPVHAKGLIKLQQDNIQKSSNASPHIHFHFHDGAEPGRWRNNKAWEQFLEENEREAFDVVHSESVALPHWLARNRPNLAVSWHGIALESLHSDIFQDLALRNPNPSNQSTQQQAGVLPKVLNEIRFFHKYAHHVAISDSCGEMLRDVYQIPNQRVHVILNGVNEAEFGQDPKLGQDFMSTIGIIPNTNNLGFSNNINNATFVFGVAGRLVKDKGHPLLYEAFSKLIPKYPNVFLIVAGAGPWEQRYKDLGPQVLVLGSMSPSKLHAFYNAIDIFVNPTLRPQGLDLTLMEAMMSGKPVMASRFPSIKGSIVVDDEFGFMFSPNVESLLEALELGVKEGSKRAAQRGKACREYAMSMFTATKMALAYERLFLCIKNEAFCTYP